MPFGPRVMNTYHRPAALFGDEELRLTQAGGPKPGEQPAARDCVVDQIRRAFEREARTVGILRRDRGNRGQVTPFAGPHEDRRRSGRRRNFDGLLAASERFESETRVVDAADLGEQQRVAAPARFFTIDEAIDDLPGVAVPAQTGRREDRAHANHRHELPGDTRDEPVALRTGQQPPAADQDHARQVGAPPRRRSLGSVPPAIRGAVQALGPDDKCVIHDPVNERLVGVD